MSNDELHSLSISHDPLDYVGGRLVTPATPVDVDLRQLGEIITDADSALVATTSALDDPALKELALAVRGAHSNLAVIAHHLLLVHKGLQAGRLNYTEPVRDIYNDLR